MTTHNKAHSSRRARDDCGRRAGGSGIGIRAGAPRRSTSAPTRPYGRQLYEGGLFKRELPTNVYRVDPGGRIDMMIPEEQVPDPNGLTLSPDFQRLYVASTGKGRGDTGPGGKGEVYVFDVGPDNKISNRTLFTDCLVDGIKCGPDGLRCDVGGSHALTDQRPKPLLSFVRIVRAAAQLNIRRDGVAALRERNDVVVLQEPRLGATACRADEGAPAAVAGPDLTLHG